MDGRSRMLTASLVGNTIEFYDFFVYANAAALVLGPLFFPSESDLAARLAAWASFALAFAARPLGAAVFGHLGDRHGRRRTLYRSLVLTGCSTVGIGLLPTFDQIGWAAPLALCLLRLAQGFGLGGEWAGAVLIAVERTPRDKRGWYGAIPQLGAPIGLVLANGVFLGLDAVLEPPAFASWGWRVPFLLSSILIVLGLWARARRMDPEISGSPTAQGATPLGLLFRHNMSAVILAASGALSGFVLFYLCSTYMLSHSTTALGLTRHAVLLTQTTGAIAMAAGVLAGGALCLRIERDAAMVLTLALTLTLGPLLPFALRTGSLGSVWLFVTPALFLMGLSYGVLGSWLPARFPEGVRYSGAAISFALAGVLGGAVTPLICELLEAWLGAAGLAFYLSATNVLSLAAALVAQRLLRRTRRAATAHG